MDNSTSTTWPIYRRLLGYVRPYWKAFVLVLIGLALTGLTEPVLPYLLGGLLDKAWGPGSQIAIWMIPTALIGLFVLRGFLTFCTSYLMTWIGNKLLVDIRREMFARMLRLPASYFVNESPGKMVSRLVFEVTNLTNAATQSLTALVQETLVIVGLLALLLYSNWRLTIIIFLLVPFIAWVIRFAGKKVRRYTSDSLQVTREMSNAVEEAVTGHKVIKVYAGHERESARFARVNEKYRAFARRVGVAESAVTPITHALASLAVAAVVTIAVMQSRSSQTTIGEFVAFVTAMLMLMAPLKRVSNLNAHLQKGIASAQMVFELLDAQPERETGTLVIDGPLKKSIRFDQVTLRYPKAERNSLDAIDLTIHAGEVVALVGPSGGGKSSLVSLLLRFEDPTQGQILFDDIPAKELSLSSLREQIALVSQDTMLFNDTIAANVSMGSKQPVVTDQLLLQVLGAANLQDLIIQLPEGLQTRIGDNGNLLSGGQRQRLAIARALIKDAPILILDEATSALDNESERAVQDALSSLMRGRTTIIVAHRLSTIQNADRIVVIDQGRIVEQGRHAELLQANGLYARLHALGEEQ